MTSKTQASIDMLNARHAEHGGCTSGCDPHDFWHMAAAGSAGRAAHPYRDVVVTFPRAVSALYAALRRHPRR